jgi:2-desacetyl-2-hydroxyethyl bacteriochlorophyllide A dehydrogenase
MKSRHVLFPSKGHVALVDDEVSLEGLRPMEVVVRNLASIISAGTELAGLHNVEGTSVFPARSGYGSIGEVLAKGSEVTDIAIGQRVFYAGNHAAVQRFTHGQDHQWGRLYPCPSTLDPIDAAVACLAQIAMTATNITTLELGDTIAVFGLGLVGNLAAQLYQLAGGRVIGVDPVTSRGALARRVGITSCIDVPAAEQVAAVRAATGGQGAEVTVDAVGHSAVVVSAIASTALMGQVILLGSPRAAVTADLTPSLSAVHVNCLTVRGAHMWQFPAFAVRGAKQTVTRNFATCFDLIGSGRLRVRELISHVIAPAEAPRAYQGLHQDKEHWSGVVIDWRNG